MRKGALFLVLAKLRLCLAAIPACLCRGNMHKIPVSAYAFVCRRVCACVCRFFVDVNELGTEAAAVTYVEAYGSGLSDDEMELVRFSIAGHPTTSMICCQRCNTN